MRKRNDEPLAVPMSQMIDVVFLLLIYFVVTMKDEISEAHLTINLPSAGAPPAAAASADVIKVIKIYVERTGYKYQIEQRPIRPISSAQLQKFLADNKKAAANSDLMISVSSYAPMQQLVTVLDYAAEHGYTKLNVLRADD